MSNGNRDLLTSLAVDRSIAATIASIEQELARLTTVKVALKTAMSGITYTASPVTEPTTRNVKRGPKPGSQTRNFADPAHATVAYLRRLFTEGNVAFPISTSQVVDTLRHMGWTRQRGTKSKPESMIYQSLRYLESRNEIVREGTEWQPTASGSVSNG